MKLLKELKEELYIGDYGEQFEYYDTGYICDVITEIADNNVDIYNCDLCEWAKWHYGYIEEALYEFGTPIDNRGKPDFFQMIKQGQFLYNENNLNENIEDILKWYMYNYIGNNTNIKELTDEQVENLEECFDFSDTNQNLENLIECIKEIIK